MIHAYTLEDAVTLIALAFGIKHLYDLVRYSRRRNVS